MPHTEAPDLAVLIGRFQPFHNGHLGLLHIALSTAKKVLVVIGSAHQARTPKNPFTWQERAQMIRLAVSPQDQQRIQFLPMRDRYNDSQWRQDVHLGVDKVCTSCTPNRPARKVLIAYPKDSTSAYIQHFEDWPLITPPRQSSADATHIRDAYFGQPEQTLSDKLLPLSTLAPSSTLEFLQNWASLPVYAAMQRERLMLQKYQQAWACAPYPPVFVTADAVVRCDNKLLIIQRGRPPGQGLYALPGGFIDPRETTLQAAVRELREETQLQLPLSDLQAALRNTAVFDHPNRSLRGRTITHAFFFDLGERALPEIQASDDAQSAQWLPIEQLSALEAQFHEDHFLILDHFLGLITHTSQACPPPWDSSLAG